MLKLKEVQMELFNLFLISFMNNKFHLTNATF